MLSNAVVILYTRVSSSSSSSSTTDRGRFAYNTAHAAFVRGPRRLQVQRRPDDDHHWDTVDGFDDEGSSWGGMESKKKRIRLIVSFFSSPRFFLQTGTARDLFLYTFKTCDFAYFFASKNSDTCTSDNPESALVSELERTCCCPTKVEGKYVSISRGWFANTILIQCNRVFHTVYHRRVPARALESGKNDVLANETGNTCQQIRGWIILTWSNYDDKFLDILLFFLVRQSFKNTGKTIKLKWRKI